MVVQNVPFKVGRREEAEDAVEVQPRHLDLLLTDVEDEVGHELTVQIRQVLVVFRSVMGFFVGGILIFL